MATATRPYPFGGRTFPVRAVRGEVFGCRPCRAGTRVSDPSLRHRDRPLHPRASSHRLSGRPSPTVVDGAAAADNESAAVAVVATGRGLPFIAFRAVSDGQGDDLMLPGYPFQFFAYQGLAAHNAAAATATFLRAWAG